MPPVNLLGQAAPPACTLPLLEMTLMLSDGVATVTVVPCIVRSPLAVTRTAPPDNEVDASVTGRALPSPQCRHRLPPAGIESFVDSRETGVRSLDL